MIMNTTNQNKKKATSKRKKRKRLRILLILESGLLLTLIAIYLFFYAYYKDHFFTNTTINGVDASNRNADQAEEVINAQVKAYTLTLEERNNIKDTIYGDSINLHTEFEGGLSDLLQKQKSYLWPVSLFHARRAA
jgi:flagellar basal body-associated protein FliL